MMFGARLPPKGPPPLDHEIRKLMRKREFMEQYVLECARSGVHTPLSHAEAAAEVFEYIDKATRRERKPMAPEESKGER